LLATSSEAGAKLTAVALLGALLGFSDIYLKIKVNKTF